MIDLNPIIEKIEAELQSKTQDELAGELGIAQTTLSAIIRGTRTLGFKSLDAILNARPQWVDLVHIGVEEQILQETTGD
jgi:transcriptional regulator with XRE-family HTH domain